MDVRISISGADALDGKILARLQRLEDLRTPLERVGALAVGAAVRRISVGGEPQWTPSIRVRGFSFTTKSGATFSFGGSGTTGVDTGRMRQSIQWELTNPVRVQIGSNLPYARYFQEGTGIYAGRSGWIVRPTHGPRDPRGRTRTGRNAVGSRPLPAGALAWSIGGRVFFAREVFINGQPPRPFLYFDEPLKREILATFRQYLTLA